jgi:hypothetical protein
VALLSILQKTKTKTIFEPFQETYFQYDDTGNSKWMQEFIPSKHE